MTEFLSIKVYPTVDHTLPSFDNTKLVAINTCPFWGIVRYSLDKTMNSSSRAMALEAGGAAHEVFAAHRLHHIRTDGAERYKITQDQAERLFQSGGVRLFGRTRFDEMCTAIDPREDQRTQRLNFCLTSLYNGGFYDDPQDKRRTTTNIEEMCIAYMDKFDWSKQMPVILNMNSDNPFIGIEIEVDVTIEFVTLDQAVHKYRFIGKADGLHWMNEHMDTMRVHENKTASRLGEAWELSWETNHQPTGYIVGLSALLGVQINNALMLGTALPLPRSYELNGVSRVPVTRQEWQIREWFQWFYHTAQLHDAFVDRPVDAPQYTHSCNRYFRPCSFIPLCASPPDERQEMIEEMEVQRWSPLEDEGSAD